LAASARRDRLLAHAVEPADLTLMLDDRAGLLL
jgi:hypothetical protein